MQIPHGQVCPRYEDGKVASRATRQVLDLFRIIQFTCGAMIEEKHTHIAVAAMLPSWDGTRALTRDARSDISIQILANIRSGGVGRKRDGRDCVGVGVNQAALPFVPRREELRRRGRANESWVRYPREADARDVTRCRVNSYVRLEFCQFLRE